MWKQKGLFSIFCMEQLENICQEERWERPGIQPKFQLTSEAFLVHITGSGNSCLSVESKAMREHICLEQLQEADTRAEKRPSFRIPEVVPAGARTSAEACV